MNGYKRKEKAYKQERERERKMAFKESKKR